jgi:ApeA N-terminal domain 1
MPARTLSESFEILGEWYLPEDPQRAIPGRLRYSQECTELHLNEAFRPLRGAVSVSDPVQTHPIIYGTTVEIEAMTLSQHLAQLNAIERRRDPSDSTGVVLTLMEAPIPDEGQRDAPANRTHDDTQ